MAQPGSSPFRARKTKVGSLQQFVHHDGFAEDYSPSVFSDLEVQRIAVFDVRTFNTGPARRKPSGAQAGDGDAKRVEE